MLFIVPKIVPIQKFRTIGQKGKIFFCRILALFNIRQYQLRPPVGARDHHEVSFLRCYMINQVLVYMFSDFRLHPMTILENIGILSLKTSEKNYRIFLETRISRDRQTLVHFFIFLIESPDHKESFDVSFTKIEVVDQFQKCRRKSLTPINIYGFRHSTNLLGLQVHTVIPKYPL